MITEKIGIKCKQLMTKELSSFLKDSKDIFVTNFTNLSVLEQEELRGKLRERESSFIVVKNSICKRAFSQIGQKNIVDFLEGSVAVILGKSDSVKIAKMLVDFSKQYPNFQIRGGLVDNCVYSDEKLKELASLPSREVLLAKIVGSINSPIVNFVCVLDAQLRRLVYILFQIKEKKSKE